MHPESFDCPSPVHPRPGDSLEAPAAAGQGVEPSLKPAGAAHEKRSSARPACLLMEFQAP
jgi:hypothetical protein